MTREEQIKKQLGIYTDDASNYTEWSDGWEDSNDIKLIEKAFINGVKWADSHPKEGLVSIDKVCDWETVKRFKKLAKTLGETIKYEKESHY